MNYGIPYIGSKSDIADKILRLIPKCETFVDLFGGGFAMTHAAIVHKKAKHYLFNELQSSNVDLIQKAIRGEFGYKTFKPEWISREEFFAQKESDPYVRICWSFGNNQKTYLFSKEIEPYKRALHNAVVFGVFDEIAEKALGFKSWPFGVQSIQKRRLLVRYMVKKRNPKLTSSELQQLRQLEQLQQLERLQQLQQLEQLEQLNITWSSLSYEQVKIPESSIVYCDPPYKGTAEYLTEFNHTDFWNWVRESKHPVFVSEYTVPHDFKVILKINKKTRLSGAGVTSTKPELLACNDVAHKMFFKNQAQVPTTTADK